MALDGHLEMEGWLQNEPVNNKSDEKLFKKSPLSDAQFQSNDDKVDHEEGKQATVPYRKLRSFYDNIHYIPLTPFRFSKNKDKLLVFVGILTALMGGVMLPLMIVLFGRVANAFICQGMLDSVTRIINGILDVIQLNPSPVIPTGSGINFGCFDHNSSENNHTIIPPQCKDYSGENFNREFHIFGGGVAILGAIQLILGYIMVTAMNAAADNQVHRIRSKFLRATLRQDIAWFDTHQAGEFASRTADDLSKLQEGIGEKLGIFIMFLTTCLACIISAFYHGWELTCVMFSIAPVIVIIVAIIYKAQSSMNDRGLKAYAKAGNVAEEVISAIRTVVAFSGESKEVDRYDEKLVHARNAGIRSGLLSSIGGAVMWFVVYLGYALAFWYGVKLILEDRCKPEPQYDPSVLIIVFFSVLSGTMTVGQSSPYIDSFNCARSAASIIFDIIDRIPPIDSESKEGLQPANILGNIEFEEVEFYYPSRAEVKILDKLSLRINRGETVALVGESGCGKSTVVQLLQRFYDPLHGLVKVDGVDIKNINLGYLRDHIGVVGQEPVLFGTTIAENIRYGKEDVKMDEIERAAKEANAHDFIMSLPQSYDTLVGERGAQLSGGQKQRIAIARALVKDPKILLLDEATSALDPESELVVQHALEKAAQGRTTIIIAHRLSTVRNADKILTIANGKVVESGTHDELMILQGAYFQLVTHQIRKQSVSDGANIGSPRKHRVRITTHTSEIVDTIETIDEQLLNMVPAFGAMGSFRRSQRKRSVRSKSDSAADSAVGLIAPDESDEKLQPSYWRLMKAMIPEWPYVLLGLIGSIGMGFSIVAYGLVLGEVMGVLSLSKPEDVTKESRYYSLSFIVIGAATAVSCFFQIFMFSIAGERLTLRLRKQSLAAMLRMEMGWFDNPVNSVGALCSRLASDASSVQGATGSRLGIIFQSMCTIGAACVISLILDWRLALVSIPFVPLVLAAGLMQSKIIMGQTVMEMSSLEKANKVAVEAISNVRTVASLHREKTFHDLYMAELKEPHKSSVRRSHIRGCVFGVSQSVPFFAYSACLFYGGKLISEKDVPYVDVFKVAQMLIMGAMMVGQAMAFAPNVNKGLISSARIFKLLDRKSPIDSSSTDGVHLSDNVKGTVKFNGVHFNYPTRPGVKVLSGLDLQINQGKVVALVGGSGCGKSTCVQLLERFYDPLRGEVELDGNDIRNVNIQSLRAKIGIVSQEPVLFDRSIAENIAYGDNFRAVSMEEIVEVARKANIHNFISSLPEGYKTRVGDKGTQLSGGQKQRIAIARALVRNPKILLLDEATSALDAESEKVVQEALEEAQKGRTCITVAHRLSTIKNADLIAVIFQGAVVEIGAHDQLIAKQGHYYKFYETQTRK